ncbi:MAG TPA: tRNA (adenosine(37)-N6)-dimethylallyltransferase MiaA [Candidatus Binataceae bacterium]|jgi:tRNA dimethylallyltransferase
MNESAEIPASSLESVGLEAAAEARTAGPSGARGGTRIGLIVGPTGAGKTTFAIEIAARLGAEIVNADSRQLYRRMDVGTAKPNAADRARVPHHLIDVRDPDSPMDVAEFAAMAQAAIAEIAARGRPVMVVGGSGLYLRVLRGGIFSGPPASADYRAELGLIAAEHGVAELYRRLVAADPVAAQRIGANDLPRIVRALEVHALSGIPISEHQRRHQLAGGGYENLAIGLTVARESLYARIDRRFDAMIADGLIDEVRRLMTEDYAPASVVRQTIGYREIARYLAGESELAAAIDAAKRESRRLAKRQMTWFRRERDLVWLDPDRGPEEALRLCAEFFRRPPPLAAGI